MYNLGFRFWGSDFWGSGIRASGSRVQNLGIEVWGLDFKLCGFVLSVAALGLKLVCFTV